jgi:hypothetical protein
MKLQMGNRQHVSVYRTGAFTTSRTRERRANGGQHIEMPLPKSVAGRSAGYSRSEITLTGLLVSTIGIGRSTPGARFGRV